MALAECEFPGCKQAAKIGEFSAEIDNLKDWEKKQNGSLDKMSERLDKVNDRLNNLQWWIIGLMGGVIASLILLITNLLVKK